MFCKVCGTENDPSSIYCSNDGIALHSGTNDYTIKKGNFSFCRECGEETLKSDLYCGNCGSSLYGVEKSKKILSTNMVKEAKIPLGFNIKGLFKFSLIASGIIFVLALISSGMINAKFVDMLASEIGQSLDVKILNVFDALAMLSASTLKLNLGALGQSAMEISLDGMFFIVILIPILLFAFLGGFLSRKYDKKEMLKEYAFTGLIYGLLMAIMTIFASRNLEVNIPFAAGFPGFETITIGKKYSFFTGFFNSLIISFFAMNFGNGIYNFIKEFKSKKYTYLSVASVILALSMIFTLMATMFMTSDDAIYGSSMRDIAELGSSLAKGQVFIYSLILINMGTFNIRLDGDIERISALSNREFLNDGILSSGYLYSGLLISIAGFFLYGRNMKKRKKTIKDLIYVPAIFALGLTILAKISSVRLTSNLMPIMSFESSHILTFLGSFLMAVLGSLAGYFITGSDEEVDSHE